MTAKPKKRADYEVGYGKPPKRTQFKKGQSGNPRGIPEPKSLEQEAADICGQLVTATIDGKRRRITVRQALIRAQVKRALNGDHKSSKYVLELSQQAPPPQVGLTNHEIEEAFQESIEGIPLEELEVLMKHDKRFIAALNKRRK